MKKELPVLQISRFVFKSGVHCYYVDFDFEKKRWYVLKLSTNEIKEYPWNGIKVLPNGQDAEDILIEHLGIEL